MPKDIKELLKQTELKNKAIDVVDLYDQANTSQTLDNFLLSLGNRGIFLKDSISELRNLLNKDEQVTLLSSKQAK